MKEMRLLIVGEIQRQIILFRRYPFEPVSSLLVTGIGFLALFFSVRISTGTGEADITYLLLRYILGMLSMFMISEMGINTANEAKVGTLERIYTMPSRLFFVITVRNFVSFLYVVLQLIVFTSLIALILQLKVVYSFEIVYCGILFMMSLMGVGYVLSGLTLIYKNIGSISQVIQFVFLFVALIPYNDLLKEVKYIVGFFPGAMAVQLLNTGYSLNEMTLDAIVALVYAVIHLVLGIVLFKSFEHKALNDSTIGRY